MKMNMKCIWGIVISFSCFPATEGENEREGKEIKSMSKCVCVCVRASARSCYLEVLHERPWVLDSMVFLQMEHPQIQQRQTAVTMETKPLEGRWKPLYRFSLKLHVVHTKCTQTSNMPHKSSRIRRNFSEVKNVGNAYHYCLICLKNPLQIFFLWIVSSLLN